MDMVKNGSTKDEVLEQTGHTVGLDNVSLNIEEGRNFCLYGIIRFWKINTNKTLK
jgi:glycine betaine/proline transport system ATP-binding protein